jgi:hypothetical protein
MALGAPACPVTSTPAAGDNTQLALGLATSTIVALPLSAGCTGATDPSLPRGGPPPGVGRSQRHPAKSSATIDTAHTAPPESLLFIIEFVDTPW